MAAGAVGMLVVILETKTAVDGIRDGIGICLQTLIPSLFPFLILSQLLTTSLTGRTVPPLRWAGKLCRIPEGAESLLAVGLLGGYPAGAQNVKLCQELGILSREDAQRMRIFCNNAGPAFLFGILGPLFETRSDIWLLWAVQIIGAIFTGIILPGGSGKNVKLQESRAVSLPEAMSHAIRAMSTVCGWVIVFRMILTFLQRWFFWFLPEPLKVLVTGFLELSNGCVALHSIDNRQLRFLLASAMLPFGGLCVTMQTASVSVHWEFLPYLLGKLLQTGICLLLAAAFLPLLNGNGLSGGFCSLILICFFQFLGSARSRKKEIAF